MINTSEIVEEKLSKKDIIGVFDLLRHWYKKYSGTRTKPTTIEIEETRKGYETLYISDYLEDKLRFDFEYDRNVVPDEVPDNNEIKDAVFKMRNRKTPGLSRLSTDIIKGWYRMAFPKKGEGEPDLEALELWNTIVIAGVKIISPVLGCHLVE